MWNSAENVFSRSTSFREEDDDEEALRWAALERLPTYDRVRRGIFRNIVGDSKEVDLSELESTDHKLLLERLVNSVDDDPEKFFDRMRKRFDAVDLEFPKIEVRFQNLTVESFVHVGSRALPTIPNFIFNMAEINAAFGSSKLWKDDVAVGFGWTPWNSFADMLVELARREKNAGIKPDEDLDIFMKSLALGGKETSLVVEYIMKVSAETLSVKVVAQFCLHQMSIGLFRVMGSLGRNMIVANTFGSFAMLVVMALGAYIISRASVNEFLGHSWKKSAGNYTNLSLGEALLKARGYFPQSYWYWIGVGALLGYTVLFNILFTFFLANLKPLGKPQAVFSKEELQERDRRRKGENVVTELRYYLQNSGSLNGKYFKQRGMVLPFQPLSMSFSNINYFVDIPVLLFMKRGGELIYAGPLGAKSYELVKYFEAVEGVPKIRPGYNPAAWMLEVTSPAEESRLGVDFAEIYRRSSLFQRNKELVETLSKPSSNSKELYFPSKESQQDLFNAMGSMYAAVLFIGITNATAVQPVVSIERFVSYRERAAGMYSGLAFAFAQVAIEFPYVFAQSVIYCSIFYSMAAFEWTVTKFIWYLFFMYFTLLFFTFYGMMTTAVTPNHNVAAIIAAPFYMLWNLFSGFMIPHKRIPIWWRWYYWANPIAWSLYGLVVSQYGDDHRMVKLADGNSWPMRQLLEHGFGYRHDFLAIAAGMVAFFVVFFALIFAFAIKAFNFQRR
ncbi:ABC-2 type transporter [Corchorus olitorius]|uniref:ABC-2 type transporter n=1 Tax=Corchorus olitorius TaxID=93759 RepID=A0A1R3GIT0_9ROSI|nr:ABC-2 type transporter [Corchorus olitorius]